MPQVNPLITTPEEQFVVGESDFAFFRQLRLPCGRRCDSLLSQRQRRRHRQPVPGAGASQYDGVAAARIYLHAHRPHGGFQGGLLLVFAGSLFRGGLPDGPFVFPRPARASDLPSAPADRRGASIWLQMAAYTYRDRGNVFRNTIIKNRLQNLLLESYDKMQRFAARQHRVPETTTRQSELFHRFVALVHEHCAQEREVSFYADKLCISTRYLSTIVRSVAHSSAKGVHRPFGDAGDQDDAPVDRPLGAGDRLPPPVPRPVLSRALFKKHTGESPTEYRNTKNSCAARARKRASLCRRDALKCRWCGMSAGVVSSSLRV